MSRPSNPAVDACTPVITNAVSMARMQAAHEAAMKHAGELDVADKVLPTLNTRAARPRRFIDHFTKRYT